MRELPFELYRAAQVRELDRIAIEERGVPGYTLMSRAGEAAFKLLRQRWPDARRFVVVCGGGNNAGDGYVVARLARQTGLDARVLTLADPESLRGDAQTAWRDAQAAEVPIAPFATAGLTHAELLVDAILGTGLERDVSGAWREAIEAMNAHPADCFALDIPSGLHADTGAIFGAAIHAAATITFIGLKQGCSPARDRPVAARCISPTWTYRPTSTQRYIRPVGATPARICRHGCRVARAAPTRVVSATYW